LVNDVRSLMAGGYRNSIFTITELPSCVKTTRA
jgi:hypothetical protein